MSSAQRQNTAIFATQLAFAAALHRAQEIEEIVKRAIPTIRAGKRPPVKIASITVQQMEACVELIESGVTPATAALNCFNIHPVTFKRYMEEGAREDGPILQREFYLAMRSAQARARAIAESRVFIEQPDTWLMRGPGGRTRDDEEGWTELRVNKLEGPTEPIEVVVSFSPRGIETRKEPLKELSDDSDSVKR